MLQPRRIKMLRVLIMFCLTTSITGYENIESSRARQQNEGDVTTVLLVDSNGRSSLGRFLSVKPAVGLLTSTARTFIQEGVTTEYATQVLGTTLDNGRLYAQLLTKSSRVLYDHDRDLPTKSHNDFLSHKKWNHLDGHILNKNINFVKNTDFISPTKTDTIFVFPSTKSTPFQPIPNDQISEEELLNSASSNNARVPYQEPYFRQKQSFSTSSSSSSSSSSNNQKIFKVNLSDRHINLEQSTENDVGSNIRENKELKYEGLSPSKIKPKMNIPTFTVRNDFSPSGYSFLGDLPEFEYDSNTERNKLTTPAERRAKLLFRGGQPVRQELKDLETVTYMGFADFTTTVGDTVIIFTPHTSTVKQNFPNGHVTSITGDATLKPTKSYKEPTVTSTIKTFLSHDPAMKTETVTGHKFTMKTALPTMVINAANRHREPKKDESEEERKESLDAKLAVLAHEQDANKYETTTDDILEPSLVETTEDNLETVITPEIIVQNDQPQLTTIYTPDVIQPSETTQSTLMLSTPSDEDIAKIFASLAALAAKASSTQATEPLAVTTTDSIINETPSLFTTESETKVLGGATTIFFEDDFDPFITNTFDTLTTSKIQEQATTDSLPTTLDQETTTENLPTTQNQQETTFNLPQITEKTTEKLIPLTEKQFPSTEREPTTVNEIITTSDEGISTFSLEESTQGLKKESTTEKLLDDLNDIKVSCSDGGKIVPTTVFKTLTYLTTFFIPVETTTTTSIKSNIVVSTEIGFQTETCSQIASSTVLSNTTPDTTITTKQQEETTIENVPELSSTTEQLTTFSDNSETTPMETTPFEITTESKHVTEFDSEPLEATTDSGEEIELIFKTLYTTYTYLTTFFQESTSSVSSRKVVITNVITSTIDPANQASDPAVAGLFAREDSVVQGTEYKTKPASFEDFADIAASQPSLVQPTTQITSQEINPIQQESVPDSNAKPTPALSDENIIQTTNALKTYYTTYTYFTTIFVDGETEISSRTEVYTNFVTPTGNQEAILPTAALNYNSVNDSPKNQAEIPLLKSDDEIESGRQLQLKVIPKNSYNSTITRQRTTVLKENDEAISIYEKDIDNIDNNILVTSKTGLEPSYTTLQRSKVKNNEATQLGDNKLFNIDDYETISTMVTDVRSSTSSGERRVIDNVDKRNVLDDQIVAESNNDSEIRPSPTLLLQTSFTTFTYFTTMYFGTTSSNVVSRLETITNVVTETLTPTQTVKAPDQTLPITYFTTFTYWTTLYKDGSTTITSREDTVSNVVTPTIETTDLPATINQSVKPTATVNEQEIKPTSTVSDDNELTTFYTTYTYFTTSYLGNSTVLNSRLETVTNVVNNTEVNKQTIDKISATKKVQDEIETSNVATPTLYPTGLLSTMVSSAVENDVTTLFSTDIYGTYIDGLYAKVLESTTKIVSDQIAPSTVVPLLPTGVLSLNQGKIVDAEGVSTLFYTTQAIGTYIDNLYAKVIESTSSLSVNEERKAALPTDLDPVALAHRTGLVRLIEGSIVENKTTTLYQSKVLGTVIDGRYAQIIESTSSFIVEKTLAPTATKISPTATVGPDGKITPTATIIAPSPVVIESSLNEDSTKRDDESTTEEDEGFDDDEDDENNSGNSRVKSRLTFQTKKRTFTPAIRPFASRNRPTFNPKRKGSSANGPTTITRTDFTPTIIATPALKADSTRGRFSGSRRQSNAAVVNVTPSGSRRFSRPKTTTSGASSASFGGSRGRSSSSRIQPTVSGSRRGSGSFRTSSAVQGRASSNLFASRGRIRPTLSSSLQRGQNTLTTPSTDQTDGVNDLTTLVTDEPTYFTGDDSDTTLPLSTTTESLLRRNQNPLLRFRRPPLPRANTGATTPKPATTPKKNGNLRKTTTTTPKPKGRAGFSRPLPPIQNRQRPSGNGLFPRRDLFKPRTPPPEEVKEEEAEDDIEPGDDLDLEDDEDTEYDSSDTNTQTEKAPIVQNRRSRANNPVQVRPFIRRRTKRQVNYSRFRRPNTGKSTTIAPTTEAPTEVTKSNRNSKSARFRPRSGTSTTSAPTATPKRITPSRVISNQGRSQFTLREKDASAPSRSNFKRPNSNLPSSRIRTTSKPLTLSRPKAPRLRTTTLKSSEETSYRNSNSRSKSTTTRSRSRSRNPSQRGNDQYNQRSYKDDIDNNFVLPTFDGTITITHQIPTEATIPIVNGKITEYKNIITAKLSTEVLIPQQYSTRLNSDGKEVKVLTSESTSVALNGATEITQFILNETPTTSVVFTPTYIRGRRTSFSHVIPSTVYSVEQVVSTIQPQLAAQAPLANILLSQLLLGNLGIPQQNPLLALQQPNNGPPPTPTTEFKTRSTTYVTTVTDATSTVIPLTFRGKEILTTIVDSSTNVITATEFITDTVVVTPTAALANNNQLNSLLLPLLLQQQQQQQQPNGQLLSQQGSQPQTGLLPLDQQQLLQDNVANDLLIQNSASKEIDEEPPEDSPAPRKKLSRKRTRAQKPTEPTPPKETSVITLYVSGKRPGEFSTVLSTVIVGEENRRKREIHVEPSKVLQIQETSSQSSVDSFIMPAMSDIYIESSQIPAETESLESIIGDVSKHIHTPNLIMNSGTKYVKKYATQNAGLETIPSGNFLS